MLCQERRLHQERLYRVMHVIRHLELAPSIFYLSVPALFL